MGFFLLVFAALAILGVIILKDPRHWQQTALAYTLCWSTASCALLAAWIRIGKPNKVQLGLMANFFIFGGILGVIFAMVFEVFEELAFLLAFPNCSMSFMDDRMIQRGAHTKVILKPITEECVGLAAL